MTLDPKTTSEWGCPICRGPAGIHAADICNICNEILELKDKVNNIEQRLYFLEPHEED